MISWIFGKLSILKNSYTNMIENAVTSNISQSHIYIQIQNNNNKISKPSRQTEYFSPPKTNTEGERHDR